MAENPIYEFGNNQHYVERQIKITLTVDLITDSEICRKN